MKELKSSLDTIRKTASELITGIEGALKELQLNHENEEKCAMTCHRYGEIMERYVIYRGDSTEVDDVHYLNVEEY